MAKFRNSNLLLKDNQKIRFGDAQDSDIYYDGSELRVSTTISGVTPTQDYHLARKDYVDTEISTLSGSIVLDHGALTGLSDDDHTQYLLRTDFTTYSGAIVAQIPTDYVSDTEMTTISGDLVTGYQSYADTISGALSSEIDSDISTLSGVLSSEIDSDISTLSGVLSAEIDSDISMLSGVLSAEIDSDISTLSGVLSAEIDSDVSTLSGVLSAEIDSDITTLSGFVATNYIDTTEMTTISGDIVAQIPTDYISDAEMTTISGDIITYVDTQVAAASGTTTFTGLTDTPANYTSSAGKVVAVNSGETALEFVAAGATNLDGGYADSTYGGTTALDGGDATSF